MTRYPAIEALLPHRSPMILLDRVEDDAPDSITCSVKLRTTSPFVEHSCVPAVVAIEYMAQCVAAHAGLGAFRRGAPIRIGYLVGVRRVDLLVDEFVVPEELTVRARRVWGDDSLGQFDCSVEAEGSRVSFGVLSVLHPLLGVSRDRPGAAP